MDKWTPELWLTSTPAELYEGTENITNPVSLPLIHQAAPNGFNDKDKVLDNGCGIGQLSEFLVKEMGGKGELICGDVDESSLEVVRGKNEVGKWGVQVEKIDTMSISYPDDTFSYVFANFVYMLLPKPIDAIKETIRVLKPGGTLALTTWGHMGMFHLFQHATLLIPTAPNMRTKEAAAMQTANGYWHDRTFIISTLEDLGLVDIQVEAFDFRQTGKDAHDLARKCRPVVKLFTMRWRAEDRWTLFEKIEEVLRGDSGEGEAGVRSVAMLVTGRKP